MDKNEVVAMFNRLVQESGLSPEEASGVLKAVENEKFASVAGNAMKRHNEWASAQDQLKSAQEKLGAQEKWYKENWPTIERDLQQGAWAQERLAQLVNAGWSPAQAGAQVTNELNAANNGGNANGAAGAQDVEQVVAKVLREQFQPRVAQTMKSVLRIASEHAAKYGKAVDPDAVEQLALKNGVDIDTAYKMWVEPLEAKAREEEMNRQIEERANALYRQRVSKQPDSGATLPPSPLLTRTPRTNQATGKPMTESDVDNELLDALAQVRG